MPEWVFFPDNRRHGGVLYFQDQERISLMIRGLVACSEGDREVEMLVATIRWAVQERKSVHQRPHELVEKRWRAADAMAAMEAVVSPAALPAWSCKLVLELLRMEPTDLCPLNSSYTSNACGFFVQRFLAARGHQRNDSLAVEPARYFSCRGIGNAYGERPSASTGTTENQSKDWHVGWL